MFEMVTDSHLSYGIAMFVIFVFAISFSIGCAHTDGTKPISDKFQLGYIEDIVEPPVEQKRRTPRKKSPKVEDEDIEIKELERQVKIAKLKKQLHDLKNPKPSIKEVKTKVSKPAIFDDCVSALTGLGTPVRKAKAETQVIFEKNPNIKTVQDFITEYGKR